MCLRAGQTMTNGTDLTPIVFSTACATKQWGIQRRSDRSSPHCLRQRGWSWTSFENEHLTVCWACSPHCDPIDLNSSSALNSLPQLPFSLLISSHPAPIHSPPFPPLHFIPSVQPPLLYFPTPLSLPISVVNPPSPFKNNMPTFIKFNLDQQSIELPGTRTAGATGKSLLLYGFDYPSDHLAYYFSFVL